MRPIIILLVVIYHSFAVYAGVWAPVEGLQQIPAYLWICKFAGGFHIEGMAFIAGYVYAFQCLSLNKRQAFSVFTKKKAKRLLIPNIIFSLLYYFLFHFDAQDFNILRFLLEIFSGSGHMWYLPMLFWCFVILWIIDKYYPTKDWLMLVLLALISIIPIPYIPFGLQRMPHFLFYCYLGYWLYEKHDAIQPRITRPLITTLWILYLLLCSIAIINVSPLNVLTSSSLISKLSFYTLNGMLGLFIACSGLMALYSTIELVSNKQTNKPQVHICRASNLSFGVYLCHQFILIRLYRHTYLLEYVGSYWFPWIGLIISLIGSVFITHLALKTRFGEFLLG